MINKSSNEFKRLESKEMTFFITLDCYSEEVVRVNCIYFCTDVYKANDSLQYAERMNESGEIIPFFADDTAYVTLLSDDHFSIANSENEVLLIGNSGVKGIDRYLQTIRANVVIINGDKYSDYLAKLKKSEELE